MSQLNPLKTKYSCFFVLVLMDNVLYLTLLLLTKYIYYRCIQVLILMLIILTLKSINFKQNTETQK